MSIDSTTPSDVEQLEYQLSTPTPGVIDMLGKLDGDLMFLGAGGKMGPTMVRMAQRAVEHHGHQRRVLAASRFSDSTLRDRLHGWGVETVACDLLDERQLASLPDARNVICMTGMKFGATANPGLMWAMNCYVPALVSRRYRDSRLAVFSSGNIYGLSSADGGGSVETDTPAPVGEYATTVLGRERIFTYFSQCDLVPIVLMRLNYATELRYGVLVDLARRVWENEPIDLSMSWVNVIWQSEANALALQSLKLAETPPRIINIAGHEILRVRDVAEKFGQLLGRDVKFSGQERDDALLNNGGLAHQSLERPRIGADQMIRWTADWTQRDGAYLGKPTHYENRAGKF
jgi:hypothetical protein